MVWFAAIVLVLLLASAAEVLIGMGRIVRLIDLPDLAGPAPKVSIVVAARNEARSIATAVASMLEQRYPDYEVVVVDDRSTDATGAILDRIAAAEPRLRVIHVTELPPGWLGKNHALQVGAEAASGEWILFTDADVHLREDVLSRAVRYCLDHGVDHLAGSPDARMQGWLLRAFGVFFLTAFLSFAKPWRARDPKSWFHVGVGAFNLVRRSAYLGVEGHRRIPLRPDDDLKLGKVLKRAGYRQDAVAGNGMIVVEWYHSLGEMVRGLEKNMFAGIEYSILLSLAGGLAQLAFGVAPLVLVFVTHGPAQLLFAAAIATGFGFSAIVARRFSESPWLAFLTPAAVLLFVVVLWRTMVVNLVSGGIRWRDTFYPLRALKANRV
ncbi:MAG: glycosyltransferase family 2 protein [Gemmatimonadales bacterium]